MYVPENSGKVKRSDIFLFALAIVFLAVFLFNYLRKNVSIPEPVTRIVFTQWWLEDLEEKDLKQNTLTDLIQEFESLHQGVKIILNYRSYEDLHRVLFHPGYAAFPGGLLSSDLIALDPLWVPELLKMEVIESPGPTLLSFINILYYNIEILIEAGFSRPPRNRSEFINYARALTGGGLTMNLKNSRGIYDDVFPWIWAAGIELIRDGRPALNTRQFIDSLSFLVSLNNEGLIIHDREDKLEDFILGRAAFMIAPVRYIRFIRERLGDEAFGITAVPTPDNYAGRNFLASAEWTIGINTTSEFKEIAQLFADFLAGNASFLSREARAVSGSDNPPPVYDPFYSKVWEIARAGEVTQDFSGLPWTELNTIFREELLSLFAGALSPAQSATVIQRRWGDVISGFSPN